MSQWYYNKDDQAHGPIEFDDLAELLKSGELGHLDQIFEIGGTEWQLVSQCAALEPFLKADEPEPSPEEQGDGPKDWVVLKKTKENGEKGYQQMGPYSKEHIFRLVEQGEVLFADYAWRAGMESWVPLNQLPEFQSPLPSSAGVDPSLYESAEAMREEEVNHELTSLADLVDIEQYQREKTQIISQEQLKAQLGMLDKQKQAKSNAVAEEIFADKKKSQQSIAPSNEMDPAEPGQLWSLAPPTEASSGEEKYPIDQAQEPKGEVAALSTPVVNGGHRGEAIGSAEPVAESAGEPEYDFEPQAMAEPVSINAEPHRGSPAPSKSKKRQPTVRPKTRPSKPKNDGLTDPFAEKSWTDSPVPWVASGVTLVVAVIFVVISFFGGEDEENIAESQEVTEAIEQIAQTDPAAIEAKREVRRLQEKLKAIEVRQKEKEGLAKRNRDKDRRRRESESGGDKIASPQVTQVKEAPKVSVAKKTPKKAASKKSKRTVSATGTVARGGPKGRSFYSQRDRKALFYAAFEAEKMVVDLEVNYKKLRSDKSKWKKYYKTWSGKFRSYMTGTLKNYPSRSEQYAYPKQMASYLQDHKLLKQYGDLHNAKVLGLRIPASPGKNMQKAFANHKSKAQSLGRP